MVSIDGHEKILLNMDAFLCLALIVNYDFNRQHIIYEFFSHTFVMVLQSDPQIKVALLLISEIYV